MTRLSIILAVWLLSAPVEAADPPPPLAEKFLHEGKLAEGENASLLGLDSKPDDDETRFGLGVIQFVRAVENLGKALYEYGAVSEKANAPFLRLPVPKNDRPSKLSYQAFGRILDAFATDLARAETTLAAIKNDQVKLRLRLANISFDFTNTGKNRTTLISLITKLNEGRFAFQKENPDFRVHFDRGDVAWLRAYCHLLSSMVEGYRAVDEEYGFANRMQDIFPNVEEGRKVDGPQNFLDGLSIVDAPRFRRCRLHLVAVCELNRETWKHILAETDNDYEWIPNPKQKDLLGLPITKERIDGWLEMMDHIEGVLKGNRLVSGQLLRFVHNAHPVDKGLNLKKLLDDPPADLLNFNRLTKDGIAAKYLEVEKGKPILDLDMLARFARLFEGPFGFAYAVRFN